MLAQQDQLLAQLIFHLYAMQVQGNVQALQRIVAKQNLVMLLHIEQLNSKYVSRALKFLFCQAQRRSLLFAVPPFSRWRQCLQCLKGTVPQNTKQVDVRQSGMKVAGHRRPEQDNALNIRASCFSDSSDKLVNRVGRNHCILACLACRLPAAACAAPARTATTKSAKSAPTTEAAPAASTTKSA